MPKFEYKVVPAPKKSGKVKGVKGTENKFAVALSQLMNEYGAEGWEYQRTDTLPCEERKGLTGRVTTFQNMLVFRRELVEEIPVPSPAELPAPAITAQDAPPQIAHSTPPRTIPTFQSAALGTPPQHTQHPSASAPTPSVSVDKDAPEGKAPPIAAQ